MIPAVWQLLIRRHIDASTSLEMLYLFAVIPAAAYTGCVIRGLIVAWRRIRTGRSECAPVVYPVRSRHVRDDRGLCR